MDDRIVDYDRSERDVCQKLTPGCCINHTAESERDGWTTEGECATW